MDGTTGWDGNVNELKYPIPNVDYELIHPVIQRGNYKTQYFHN